MKLNTNNEIQMPLFLLIKAIVDNSREVIASATNDKGTFDVPVSYNII